MRINLRCPFAEKDQAKALGAKWDLAKKTWYITDVEDITPFMRWISQPPPQSMPGGGGSISLSQYLSTAYAGYKGLSAKAARAFGIPYPLEAGWVQKYADRTISNEALKHLPKTSVQKKARPPEESFKPIITTSAPVKSCGCSHVLPWEDCEHTAEASEAEIESAFQAAMGLEKSAFGATYLP